MPDLVSSQAVRASMKKGSGIVDCETELRMMLDRVIRSKDALKRVVLVTGHDLQEPIRTINASCEHLLADCTALDGLQPILKGVARMREIVQALLSYCVMATPKDLVWVDTCLEVVCQEIEFSLAAEITSTAARIVRHSLPTVRCDRNGIVEVLKNLISNSIKYRTDGTIPIIEISAERTIDEYLITIGDNGIGFDSGQAERIFEPFSRLYGKEIPGTGIGLTICRTIVEQHGGKIWARSSPGCGSTFCFTLPCTD